MSTRPPPTFCFQWDLKKKKKKLNSFPRQHCCLPLFYLFSFFFFISFPLCANFLGGFIYLFICFGKRENRGVERGQSQSWRIWRGTNQRGSAVLSTSSQEVPVAWAGTSLTGPFMSRQKSFCGLQLNSPPPPFFFFYTFLLSTCSLLPTGF